MADSLYDPRDLAAITARIETLRPHSPRRWGKMHEARMLAHCQQPLRVALGDLELKRSLIGVLFGRMAKKQLLDPAPRKPGMPTATEWKVTNERDFATEKAALLALVQRFGETLQWRHVDHHLRQFGV